MQKEGRTREETEKEADLGRQKRDESFGCYKSHTNLEASRKQMHSTHSPGTEIQ
jgi:hypothetical protein